jgi:transposase
METESTLGTKYEALFQHLDERQRRLVAAADAEGLGRGGASIVARASGLSRPTIHKGLRELREAPLPAGQVRRPGAGRKRVEDAEPALLKRIEQLIDPATRGDPMSALRWTSKSTRHLAQVLNKEGYDLSHETVAHLLHGLGYSLQANAKMLEGAQHPDRNEQFEYINTLSRRFLRAGAPVMATQGQTRAGAGS